MNLFRKLLATLPFGYVPLNNTSDKRPQRPTIAMMRFGFRRFVAAMAEWREHRRGLSRDANARRPRLRFYYEWADGTADVVKAATPGDARAALKLERGRLPTVVHKHRSPLR